MTDKPTLADFFTAEMSDEEAASAVLAAVKKRALSLDALFAPVLSWISSTRRTEARHVERHVRTSAPRRSFPGAADLHKQVQAERSGNDWKRLLNQKFKVVRGGKEVTWGSATVAEHLERAEALEAHARETNATASMHREAAADLQAAGVECLNFLEDPKAA